MRAARVPGVSPLANAGASYRRSSFRYQVGVSNQTLPTAPMTTGVLSWTQSWDTTDPILSGQLPVAKRHDAIGNRQDFVEQLRHVDDPDPTLIQTADRAPVAESGPALAGNERRKAGIAATEAAPKEKTGAPVPGPRWRRGFAANVQ